jgi:hypothetical protein
VRSRWRRTLVVALLVGVVAGIVLTLAAGARRTASAPDRYTAASGGDPELVVRQPSGEPLTDAVRQLPGVAAVRAITFVPAFSFRDGALIDLNPSSARSSSASWSPVTSVSPRSIATYCVRSATAGPSPQPKAR